MLLRKVLPLQSEPHVMKSKGFFIKSSKSELDSGNVEPNVRCQIRPCWVFFPQISYKKTRQEQSKIAFLGLLDNIIDSDLELVITVVQVECVGHR